MYAYRIDSLPPPLLVVFHHGDAPKKITITCEAVEMIGPLKMHPECKLISILKNAMFKQLKNCGKSVRVYFVKSA